MDEVNAVIIEHIRGIINRIDKIEKQVNILKEIISDDMRIMEELDEDGI